MIILDTTNRSLQALLDSAIATSQLPIVASFVDFADGGFIPASSTNETNDDNPVTAVAAPAATTTRRQVKFLAIRNADTAPAVLSLRFNDNGTMRVIWAGTLAVGDSLFYTDGEGLRVIDSNGQVKQTSSGGTSDHAALSNLGWAASAHTGTANRFPHFDGSGAADLVAETGSGAVVRDTSPTIVTPTIASFANANHTHQNSAGGGTLDAAALASGTVATARLGSGTANSGTFLRGDQSWAAGTGGAPTGAEYLVGAADGTLSAERVVTDTTGNTGITWDLGTGGQAKANATNAGKWIKLATATASSSATVDFTGLSSGFAAYKVVWSHIAPATDNVELSFRTSSNGGSSYDSAAGNYRWSRNRIYAAGSLNLAEGSASATEIRIATQCGNAANESSSGTITIINPSSAAYGTVIWQQMNVDLDGSQNLTTGQGQRLAAADVDAIRFQFSSGNIASGQFNLYGLSA